MLTAKKQPYNSIWIKADSQSELGLTFMRFQEFYESANPQFKNNIFTIGQLKYWYSETYGANDYHITWTGFNFPSRVLEPFKDGLFDPLTLEETNLLNLLAYRKDNFYIIGAQDSSTLRHELSHALYDSNIDYRHAINKLLQKNKNKLHKQYKYLLDKGYCEEVLNDELQAYITDNDDQTLISTTCPKIIAEINRLYNRFKHES